MEEREYESAGQQFVRFLKPGGCILFLLIGIVVTVMLFTSGADPIPGFEPAHDTAYYAEHLDELQAELEENVFPLIDGFLEWHVEDATLHIEIESANFAVARAALLRYYEESLFTLTGNNS